MTLRTIASILFLIFSCVIVAQQSSTKKITLANRQWTLGYQDENQDTKIQEYVTNNETVNNWTELFTFQLFKSSFPKEISPSAFADREMEGLKTKGYKYQFSKLSSSAKEAVIEFRVSFPEEEQQDEIQRIIRNEKNQMIVIHYVIRKEDMGDGERKKMGRSAQKNKPGIV